MPFRSVKQQRAMEAKAGRGEISKKVIKEFETATKKQPGGFSSLPEKVAGKSKKKSPHLNDA